MSLGRLPLWGGAAAAFLALGATYAKRERLKRAWAAARARAARIAWDAADRARRLALIQAVVRYRAQHPPKAKPPQHDAPTAPEEALMEGEVIDPHAAAEARRSLNLAPDTPSSSYTPPPGTPEAALLEGEVIDPHAAAEAKRHLNLAAHVPPHGDGSFNPFRGRGLWGNEHGPVTPTPQPVDVAKWKQADYQGVAAYQTAMRADEDFDAEVGVEVPPDIPTIGPYPAVIKPYHPKPPWYERWKLPKWFKGALGAKKALGNTSIRANEWDSDRYALSTNNPNVAQQGLRWLKEKWQQWIGKEPPAVLDEVDEALQTGGPLVDDGGEILEGFGLKPGGGFHAASIETAIKDGVIDSAKSAQAFGVAALVSVAQNVIAYGFGSKKDLGLRSPEFFTSTVVDTGVNVLLGLATAGVVALVGVPLLGLLGVSASVAAVGAVSLAAGIGVSWIFNRLNTWLGSLITKQKGITLTDWIKRSWAQHIEQTAKGPSSDTDDLNRPDTPDSLAP